MIRHHLNPAYAVENYDVAQLDAGVQVASLAQNTQQALAQWQTLLDAGMPTVRPIRMTTRDVDDLVAFMEALTDPCVKDAACLAPWMPTQEERDPDGLRLELRMASAN